MRTENVPAVRLADYAPPDFLADEVALSFRLAPKGARVRARVRFRRNPDGNPAADLRLDGRGLRLVSAAIDGAAVPQNALSVDAEGLTVAAAHVPDGFVWEAETEIDPESNTALEGLYMSRGMYCTQCEAQGFRKITYWPDRPDVMARFRVRVEGDLPVLLSNGNLVASGEGWAEWEDPFPKPSYLFALVAGDLRAVEDRFVVMSGREVLLQIWVRPGDEDRCAYAMDSLKRSMTWDEEAYGREYDLDRFKIVAVDDFNMGAMENKGLNVFNSRFVLASPETATDGDYAAIERIIAHEYFHNWTGNRITCRDWFQLSLKEGLTVFRDQQFAADMRSRAVKRIEDVIRLRATQVREDAGPLAHPVRPEEYVEINNFYTPTVYEKGAEVIRMLHALVGPEAYRRALDRYFERHDGQACTIEDWLGVFEDTTGRDLSQFKRWYAQADTPRVSVAERWQGGRYTLELAQRTPPTPGQPEKAPLLIPVAYGLLDAAGGTVAEGVLELDTARRSFEWDLAERPVPSLLRGFSAPVILEREAGAAERAFLIAHDDDPFNRWEAGTAQALGTLARLAEVPEAAVDPGYLAALAAVAAVADDPGLDPAFKALALGLPSEEDAIAHVAGGGSVPDPLAIHRARRALTATIAAALGDRLGRLYAENAVAGPYGPDADAAGRRALRARALALLTALDPEARAARAQFAAADNMTERMAALGLLVAHGRGDAELAAFHAAWAHDRLVVDKWFAVQGALTPPEAAVETVERLTRHADFDWKNPNRFRSLIGGFAAANPAGFHRADGGGYRLFVDWLCRLDPVNPQTTARMATSLGTWRMFDTGRQRLIRGELERLAALPGLSDNTAEIVGRLLRAEPGSPGRACHEEIKLPRYDGGMMREVLDQLIEERAPWLRRRGPGAAVVRPLLHAILQYERTVKIGQAMEPLPSAHIMDALAEMIGRHVEVDGLEHIPRQGAAMVVANHPTGIADGIVLWGALAKIRPDLFFFANSDAVRVLPQLADLIAPVEWRPEKRTHRQNRETMDYARNAFADGRLAVLFPSGRLAKRTWWWLNERPWMASGATMARKFELPVIPLHITARNSALFYLFDRIHPTLRDITLFHEVLNKKHQRYRIALGPAIDPESLPAGSTKAIEVLKASTLALGGAKPQTVLTAPIYGRPRGLKPA